MKHHIYTFIGLLAISTFLFPLGMKADTTSGLVGWWTMDWNSYRSPITMVDSSGNGNTGTLNPSTGNQFTSTSTVPGKMGQALKFNGSSQYVVQSSASTVVNPSSSALSISMWMKVAGSWNQGETGYNRRILMQGINANNEFMVAQGNSSGGGIEPDRRIVFVIRSGGVDWQYSMTTAGTTNMAPGTWFNVVCTWNPTGPVIHMYINGVDQGLTSQGSAFSLGTADNKLYIGERSDGHAFFNGSLDDVRVYNRALSAQDVYQLYQTTAYNYIMPRGY